MEDVLYSVECGKSTEIDLLDVEYLGDVLGEAGVASDPAWNSAKTSRPSKAGAEAAADWDVVRDVRRVCCRT